MLLAFSPNVSVCTSYDFLLRFSLPLLPSPAAATAYRSLFADRCSLSPRRCPGFLPDSRALAILPTTPFIRVTSRFPSASTLGASPGQARACFRGTLSLAPVDDVSCCHGKSSRDFWPFRPLSPNPALGRHFTSSFPLKPYSLCCGEKGADGVSPRDLFTSFSRLSSLPSCSTFPMVCVPPEFVRVALTLFEGAIPLFRGGSAWEPISGLPVFEEWEGSDGDLERRHRR